MAAIRKKGELQWHVQIRRKSVKETRTFTHRADAEAWARKIESEIDRGVYVSMAEAESTSFGEVCDRYGREIVPKLKGATVDISRIKGLKLRIGNLLIAAITSATLAKYRDDRLKEVKSQTVIHELNMINRILKTCTVDWGIALPHGVPVVRKPSKPNGRSRRVDASEIDCICKESESVELPAIVMLAVETAMRRGELTKLRWNNVDLTVPVLYLYRTKNNDDRSVPLSTKAVATIKALPRQINGKLFSLKADSITQAFDRAVVRCRNILVDELKSKGKADEEIEVDKRFVNLHFHDLRHEATSRIAEKVANLIELAAITGHKDLQSLKRYYHPKAGDLAKKLG
jgi:integrase